MRPPPHFHHRPPPAAGPLLFTTGAFKHNARVAALVLPALALVAGSAGRAVLGLAMVGGGGGW